MITLKLSAYSQTEVDKLANILRKTQQQLAENCKPSQACSDCPVRHLCIDISQATMYAEEYEAER